MTDVEDPQIDPTLAREDRPVLSATSEQVRACRTQGQALDLAIRASGLERKEIYLTLVIDPGTFSKIIEDKGANFPVDKVGDLCRLLMNRVFLEWLNWQCGCMAVMVKSEAEYVAEAALERARCMEVENKLLRELLGVKVGSS